jgi:hypothetical protein
VDVESDPEELSSESRFQSGACPASSHGECEPAACRLRCATEVIDDLLAHAGAVSGEEMDLLLDLRWHLRHRSDAEISLRLFCEARRRMEARHYLAFFRLRRWLENHLVAEVRVCPAAAPQWVSVKLNHYCVEALRRLCLCKALGEGSVLLAPRLRFDFRPQLPVQPLVGHSAAIAEAT